MVSFSVRGIKRMKLITRNTDYAIKALGYICTHKGRIISVADLVEELNIPRPFLRRILQVLNKKKVLKSYKGRGGGFTLAYPPEKIFLMDLIEILQGPFMINRCIFKKNLCPDGDNCALKSKISDIEQKVITELKSITLASLT